MAGFPPSVPDLLILILLVAAAVSLVVTREWETPVAISLVILLNDTIGFVQESRAEASLEALKQMLVTTATVRRDGRTIRVDAAELVPGDVITVEAADPFALAMGAGRLAKQGAIVNGWRQWKPSAARPRSARTRPAP